MLRIYNYRKFILLLACLVFIGCTSKRKNDVDLYLNANVNTQADVERELEKAKAFQGSGDLLGGLAKSADTSPGDIIGALEVKGFSRKELEKAAKKAGFSGLPGANAKSSLNWDPASARSVPPPNIDPDAIHAMGPHEFSKVVTGLEVARVELEELVKSEPHDWSLSVPDSKCVSRKAQNVCIVQESLYGQYKNKAALGCSGKNMFLVNSPAEIRAAFERLEADCVQIDKLELHSHGLPGRMTMGISISNVDPIFLGMSHLFTARSKIHAVGCSVGKACMGSVLMLKMARQAMWLSGGHIEAPTQTIYFSTVTGHITLYSDDSKHIRYSSAARSGEWIAQSPRLGMENEAPLGETCGGEIEANIEKIKSALAASGELKRCSIAKVSVRVETLNAILACVHKILQLPEARLDNLRLRALANISDLLQKHVDELSLQCK